MNNDNSQFAVSTYNKISQKYTELYFNDVADIPYIDEFVKLLPKDAKVLDIGCGPGTFTQYLKAKGFDVEGIDLSSEMIKVAREKLPDVVFKEMDMRHLDYPDNHFDGLLAAYSLIHIPSENVIDTLKGFQRVLKPGGYLMIINQIGEADRIIDEPLKEGEKIFVNFYTAERLNSFLSQSGLEGVYQKEVFSNNDPDSLSDKFLYTIVKK